ncbi:ABATE domain-containing protein [Streptomyces tubercidicus]|uniref:ABATE domain-containing protein n=1 Tax=Streptomyces tubercidicus TaxID=47759 RepID=UPI003757E2DD
MRVRRGRPARRARGYGGGATDYGGVRQDLLTGPEGLHIWLASNSLDRRFPADAAALEHVLVAREALAAAVDSPGGRVGIEKPDHRGRPRFGSGADVSSGAK